MTSQVRTIEADLTRPDHQSALIALLNELAVEDGGPGLPPEVRESMITGLQEHGGALVLFSMLGEEPIGAAVCFRGYSTFAARPLLNIHDLVVAAAHRGRGAGRQLLQAVAKHARALGCCKVTLEVRADNVAAQRLYAAEGFGAEDRKTYFLRKKI